MLCGPSTPREEEGEDAPDNKTHTNTRTTHDSVSWRRLSTSWDRDIERKGLLSVSSCCPCCCCCVRAGDAEKALVVGNLAWEEAKDTCGLRDAAEGDEGDDAAMEKGGQLWGPSHQPAGQEKRKKKEKTMIKKQQIHSTRGKKGSGGGVGRKREARPVRARSAFGTAQRCGWVMACGCTSRRKILLRKNEDRPTQKKG